jgi:hypothetical protein
MGILILRFWIFLAQNALTRRAILDFGLIAVYDVA